MARRRSLHGFVTREAASTGQPRRPLTFAQARLLCQLIATPGASLVIEAKETGNPYDGPRFRGFFWHPSCPTCHHANQEAVSWRVIHALAEGGHIKATWANNYDRVTERGAAAAAEARKRWPRMVVAKGIEPDA